MATPPLVPFAAPDVGDGSGVAQLVVSRYAHSLVGAATSLLRVGDVSGRTWQMLLIDLMPTAAQVLLGSGPQVPAVWPLLVRDGPGRRVTWDGMTSLRDARAVSIGGQTVSWLSDTAGLHVCVASSHPDMTPDGLLRPLVACGAVNGWADLHGHERRWLRANVAVVAPSCAVPDQAGIDELRAGLARLTGYPSVAAMLSAGGYGPEPLESGLGGVVFRRIRPVRLPRRLESARLIHRLSPAIGPGGVIDVLESGVLASQRARRTLGVPAGVGRDEQADRQVGLDRYVFIDVEDDPGWVGPLPALVWDEPSRLLRRLDWVGVPYDPLVRAHIGRVEAAPHVVLDPSGTSLDADDVTVPQVAVAGAVHLYGRHGPDRVLVRDTAERADVLAALTASGVVELAGRPTSEMVVVADRSALRA